MLDLFRAEWIKVLRLRRALAYLLLIFPLVSCVAIVLYCLVAALYVRDTQMIQQLFGDWRELMTASWLIANYVVSRLFLVAFTVVVVAGEYQWGTWKNLTLRRRRTLLLLNKLVVVSILVILTFVFESFLLVAGGRLVTWIARLEMGPELSAAVFAEFLPAYLTAAFLTFLSYLITGVFAVLAAVYSRTILGGALTGVALVSLESLMLLVPPRLAGFLEMPGLLHLGRALPFYNVENLRSWMSSDAPWTYYDGAFQAFALAPPADTMAFSALVLAAWIALGLTAACVLFERQDITS